MNDIIRDVYNLKHTLRFNKDGRFRILTMSDTQETSDFNPLTLELMEDILDEAKPDLVLFGGDNCQGGADGKNDESMKKFLDTFTGPIEKRKIPWAHVFGNHDHENAPEISDILKHQKMYEAYPMCVSKHTEDAKTHVTNFVLPILASESDEIKYTVWGLDTGRSMADFNEYSVHGDLFFEAVLPKNPLRISGWGSHRFEQLMWYWNYSKAIEDHAGKKVPGMLIQHQMPAEFAMASANREKCSFAGSLHEEGSSDGLNSGLFIELLQRQDIKLIVAGHQHNNDAIAEYCGITMCYDACSGLTQYGHPDTRGGRVIDIDESCPEKINTFMIHHKDILARKKCEFNEKTN